jgi:hypothetical protein
MLHQLEGWPDGSYVRTELDFFDDYAIVMDQSVVPAIENMVTELSHGKHRLHRQMVAGF